jgi:nucleoid-associated protein YejK
MKVEKVIIHELHKPLGTAGAKLSKSKSLMDCTHSDVIELISELNKRYRKKDEKQGVFDKDNQTKFHSSFSDYYNDRVDEKFIEFSHTASENLKDRIEGIGSAKGGYLVYSLYFDHRLYCSVFFVRDTTGMRFKRNKTIESFDIDKVQHIDFEKLAMACRINMDLFTSPDKKYLSFIHNRNDDLSQYFVNWISSANTVSSEEETKLLLHVLRTIAMPVNPNTNEPFERDEIIRSSHRYISDEPTRTVNLFDLSKHIFQDVDYLPEYIYKNHPEIPTEFRGHHATLKQFIKVYAKADNIELNFYPSAYREGKIKFDETDSTQIIIRSEELVKQIRTSLAE